MVTLHHLLLIKISMQRLTPHLLEMFHGSHLLFHTVGKNLWMMFPTGCHLNMMFGFVTLVGSFTISYLIPISRTSLTTNLCRSMTLPETINIKILCPETGHGDR